MSDSIPSLDTVRRRWWKEGVVYQIYPRSFNDANGDGVGDLPGITERLDYLDDLGVDVVWLSPVYDSPMADNGYDIRDYRGISDLFGTMDDFDRMLSAMHERGLRLVMDWVANHTSDEHAWFEASRSSKDDPKRDFYIWRPPGPNGERPNNWRSFFGGPAWTFDETTGEYYLHLFDSKQPDLNWDNPDVRHATYDDMRFWLDKGVDGFRLDVISMISKKDGLPDIPDGETPFRFYANGPHIHDYLQEMTREVLSNYDVMTVGEGYGINSDEALDYVGTGRDELQTFFQFDHTNLLREPGDFYRPREWRLPEMKAVFQKWDDALAEDGWNAIFLGNHDQPRMVSSFGDDREAYRERSAKLLMTFLLTMRGTPYVYQGDELGMTNAPFETLSDFEDVSSIGDVRERVEAGEDPETVLEHHRTLSRDNARTPMQWDATDGAGFTDGTPWLAIHPNHTSINAEAATKNPDSVYHYTRRIIALRKEHPTLVYGRYVDLLPSHENVWAYRRETDEATLLVVLNWSAEEAALSVSDLTDAGPQTESRDVGVLVSNYDDESSLEDADESTVLLRPWESVICEIVNAKSVG